VYLFYAHASVYGTLFAAAPSRTLSAMLTLRAHSCTVCTLTAAACTRARHTIAAACWLVTLLIWEVTFLPNLQWDDWVHHVLTSVVLAW
jgi:hypothetical protein